MPRQRRQMHPVNRAICEAAHSVICAMDLAEVTIEPGEAPRLQYTLVWLEKLVPMLRAMIEEKGRKP